MKNDVRAGSRKAHRTFEKVGKGNKQNLDRETIVNILIGDLEMRKNFAKIVPRIFICSFIPFGCV